VVVARNCLEDARWPNPLILLPLACGLAVSLLFSGAGAVIGGIGAVVLSAVLVQLVMRPFAAQDAELIEALDIPARPRAALAGLLRRAGGGR
jgi:hypothetical protein